MGYSGGFCVLGLFRGASNLSLDDKGRLTVPTKYRAAIMESCNGNLIITVDLDGCLMFYPCHVWLEIEQKIAELPTLNKQARMLQRYLIGFAEEITMDKNGRMLIPSTLRDYAGLEKDILLLGQGNKFEIWADDKWKRSSEEWMEEKGDKNDLIGDLESLSF